MIMSRLEAFPYYVRSTKKYRSPHAQDLSFGRGVVIRVLSIAPRTSQDTGGDGSDDDDDEDIWLIGELHDGSATGTFPGNCVVPTTELVDETSAVKSGLDSTKSVAPSIEEPSVDASQVEKQASQPQEDVMSAALQFNERRATGEAIAGPIAPRKPVLGIQRARETMSFSQEEIKSIESAAKSKAQESELFIATPEASVKAGSPAASGPPLKAGPPPTKPKPSVLAARIAAFNQTQSSGPSPPLPHGSKAAGGAGWKRPTPAAREKPLFPLNPVSEGSAVASFAGSTPNEMASDSSTSEQSSRTNKGFSAADAASSIKISLKERMAVLQRGTTEGQRGEGDLKQLSLPSASPASAAKADMQGPKTAEKSLASSGWQCNEAGKLAPFTAIAGSQKTGPSQQDSIDSATMERDAGSAVAAVFAAVEQRKDDSRSEVDDASKEDDESERRAAIAQRMARLGGQRFGGPGPALFGTPKAAATLVSVTSATESAGISGEALRDSPDSSQRSGARTTKSVDSSEVIQKKEGDGAEQQPAILNVPRRAAPPRRKPNALMTSVNDPNYPSSGDAGAFNVQKAAAAQDSVPSDAFFVQITKEDSSEPVSGPQPKDVIVDLEHTAEQLRAVEGTNPVSLHDDEFFDDANAQSLEIQGEPNAGATFLKDKVASDPDEMLQRQSDQLNSFLRDSSRQNSSRTDVSTGFIEAGQSAEEQEVHAADEPSNEIMPIPPALARQLGLTPTSEKSPSIGESSADLPAAAHAEEKMEGKASTTDSASLGHLPRTAEPSFAGHEKAFVNYPRRPRSFSPAQPDVQQQRTLQKPDGSEIPSSADAGVSSPTVPLNVDIQSPLPKNSAPQAASAGLNQAVSSVTGPPLQRTNDRLEDIPDAILPAFDASPILQAPRPMSAVVADNEKRAKDEDEGRIRDATNEGIRDAVERTGPGDGAKPTSLSCLSDAGFVESGDAPGDDTEAELASEQEAAAWRAAIARRMAALGGQRMGGLPPIIGAPMPPGCKGTLKEPETCDSADDPHVAASTPGAVSDDALAPAAPGIPRGPPVGGMAIPGMTKHQRQGESDPQSHVSTFKDRGSYKSSEVKHELVVLAERTGGPPMKPTSPAPIPKGVPYPSISPPPHPPSSVITTNAGEMTDITGRQSSIRPPIPSVAPPAAPRVSHDAQQSGEGSLMIASVDAGTVQDHVEQVAIACLTSHNHTASPPVITSTPLPRDPTRAPRSVTPSASFPPGAQLSDELPAASTAEAETQLNRGGIGREQGAASITRHIKSDSATAGSSARNLDLAPASKWWRKIPLELPPTLESRTDAICSLDHQPGRGYATIQILFDDYSITVIQASWLDEANDPTDSQTILKQTYKFPPPKPSEDEMRSWTQNVGVEVAKEALLAVTSKTQTTVLPSSYALTARFVAASQRALPPVGSSFGATVLSQVGSTILDRGSDDVVRAGDVVQLQGANFKGKKGLGSYHVVYGSPPAPDSSEVNKHSTVFGVVVEVDTKKHRWRVVTTSNAANTSSKPTSSPVTVEEIGLRMDDLRAGVVKVMRVVPRAGPWIQGFG